MGVFRLPQPRLRPVMIVLAVLIAMSVSPSAFAQGTAEQAPAHIAVVDGATMLEREAEIQDAAAGVPFVPGDRLRTEAGRAEILFPDGSSLDLDEFTAVELLSPTLVRMTTGRVLLRVTGVENPSAAVRYQIDTPVASATTDGPGEFRVTIFSGPEAELAVLRGFAALSTERGTTPVRAGERSLARDNLAPSAPQYFNAARFDAFDRWSETRRFERAGTASARYLPTDLRMYGGAFDRYGAWQYEPLYGYVWYPAVAVDWRPYYYGYWSPVRTYGWTWIGFDSWSWPTHHYGRWGHSSSRWFWIPERRWSPAWVSWGAAPGYVSWCPLGFDNLPVFGLSVNVGNPWAGWTVVPRGHFGRDRVSQWAVDGRRFGGRIPLMASDEAPVAPPTRAVPRNTVGEPVAAGSAVPRARSSQSSIAGDQPSTVPGRLSAGGGRQPVADNQNAIRAPQMRARNPQSAVGALQQASPNQQWPTGGAPSTGNAGTGGGALLRQPSRTTAQTPRPAPNYDVNRPGVERSRAPETWRTQPLPQTPTRTYRRLPDSESTPGNAAPQYRAVPRWSTPGAPASETSAPTPNYRVPSRRAEPQSSPTMSAPNQTASPRWSPYGDNGAGTRGAGRSEPQREAAPPAQAPRAGGGAVYRNPGAASPRAGSAPPPSSGSGGSDGGARSAPQGSGSGGGAGARQRHP